MNIRDLLDYDLLIHHQIQGLISKQDHPILPLRIYNYTQKAQFEPHWGDGVIDYCRGLIVDKEGEIVARPFKKFHNLNTVSIPETMEENLPFTVPTITKKMDGSLGIYYSYDGVEGIATRGSFTSDQAKWATEWYNNQIKEKSHVYWASVYTPLFEIIYNANRIVINYDFEGLVLLALINKELGNEAPHSLLQSAGQSLGIRVVKKMKDTPITELVNRNIENEEGYVLNFHRLGDPLKIKIKMADYVKLHRIITGMNPRSVWELMRAGTFHIDNFKDCPASFRAWLLNWTDKLSNEFMTRQEDMEKIYINRPIYDGGDKRRYRAECAAYFKRQDRDDLKGLFFSLLDGKNIDEVTWNLIEPRGDDKTFRVEGE
jgi:RNA ligase